MGCDMLLPRVCGFVGWINLQGTNIHLLEIVYRTWGGFIAVSGGEERHIEIIIMKHIPWLHHRFCDINIELINYIINSTR